METLFNDEIESVFGRPLNILPHSLTSVEQLTDQFKDMLGSAEAGRDRGVVYCYLAYNPIKTTRGETCILYLGKTKSSIKRRYFQYAGKLSRGNNAIFYQKIIEQTGGVKMGYICSDFPRNEEKLCFHRYRALHGQMPPKSQRG